MSELTKNIDNHARSAFHQSYAGVVALAMADKTGGKIAAARPVCLIGAPDA
jgi:hypothetical protein